MSLGVSLVLALSFFFISSGIFFASLSYGSKLEEDSIIEELSFGLGSIVLGIFLAIMVHESIPKYVSRLYEDFSKTPILTVIMGIIIIIFLLILLYLSFLFFDLSEDDKKVSIDRTGYLYASGNEGLFFLSILCFFFFIVALIFSAVNYSNALKIGISLFTNPLFCGLLFIMPSIVFARNVIMRKKSPDYSEHYCINCGKGKIISKKVLPGICYCGLPIFSDPDNMKNTNDLFWIRKENFDQNIWSEVKLGIMSRLSTIDEYAFRIVNNVQRLDTIIQFKFIGRRFVIQQDGRDITSSSSRAWAECIITNSHGVPHKYRVFWRERDGAIIFGTDNSVGQNEERTWCNL